MVPDDTGQTLQGVGRAFKIIRFLSRSGQSTVTDVANQFDIPTSTAHIHLKTMYEAGYLHRSSDASYRLSLRFLEHGAVVRRRFEIYGGAHQEVRSIANETGEVASLGVEEDGKRVLLYKSEGGDAVYDDAVTGEFTHLHWVSLGKAILAYLPEDRVKEIVENHGLPGATEHTITDVDELHRELEQVREDGYAVEDEEHRENIRAVSVPIRREGEPLGAISVSGPKSRFDDTRIEEDLVETLQDRANVIELRLKHY